MRQVVRPLLVILTLVAATLMVNAATITGTIGSGSNGEAFEQEFANSWNDSSEFSCTNESPFTVTATSGACSGESVEITFLVNNGETNTAIAHDFEYEVLCIGSALRQRLAFDGAELVGINGGSFLFLLAGGDEVIAITAESVAIPTLGEWGVIALMAAVLITGIFLILRRYRPSLEPA